MYRVKAKIGWSGKMWYVVQRRYLFLLWVGVHDYESKSDAEHVAAELNHKG